MRHRTGSAFISAVASCVGFLTCIDATAASMPERPCTAFWNAAVVFAGRVDAIARTGAGRRVTFTVIERFRPAPGDSHEPTIALDLPSSSPCTSRLRPAKEYIVYADVAGSGLSLARCSRTRPLDDAAADVSYARSVLEGSAPPGTIEGRVMVSVRDLAGRISGPAVPVSGVVVRAGGAGRQQESATNHAGDFTLANSDAGTITVGVDVPPRYYGESATAVIERRDTRACADVELRLAPDGRLTGRLVDSRGRPVAGMTVEASTLTLTQRRVTVTDRDGRYELTRLPPGRFVIGVGSGARAGTGRPGRVFLPGVDTAASAARLVVGEGAHETAPEFRLPAAVPYVALSGFVLDADGRPAEGALVYLKGANEGDRIVGEPVAADFVGRFSLATLGAGDYLIFAERKRGTRVDSSDPVRVTLAAVEKPIRLTLRRRY